MRSSAQRFFAATLLACLLVSTSVTPRAQDSRQTVTRPRRATSAEWPTTTPDDASRTEVTQVESEPAHITSEPSVRIGLATDARSVTVSTTGRLLDATETGTPPAPFDVARLRIEPRSLPPLPAPTPDGRGDADGVETAAASSDKSKAGGASPVRRSAADDDGQVPGQTAARQARAAGARPSVQLTSRLSAPVRGEAVYAPGTTRPLLDARAPVLFASADEEQHPVRL